MISFLVVSGDGLLFSLWFFERSLALVSFRNRTHRVLPNSAASRGDAPWNIFGMYWFEVNLFFLFNFSCIRTLIVGFTTSILFRILSFRSSSSRFFLLILEDVSTTFKFLFFRFPYLDGIILTNSRRCEILSFSTRILLWEGDCILKFWRKPTFPVVFHQQSNCIDVILSKPILVGSSPRPAWDPFKR